MCVLKVFKLEEDYFVIDVCGLVAQYYRNNDICFYREDKGDQLLDYKQEVQTMEEQLKKLQKEVRFSVAALPVTVPELYFCPPLNSPPSCLCWAEPQSSR